MNEREMLELAAKAAGLPYIKPTEDYDGSLGLQVGSDNPMRCWEWNPLKDDGDALRLAVKLGISVAIFEDAVGIGCRELPAGQKYEETPLGNDPYSTTRLSITRAAAEIGRSMQ